MLFDWSLVEMDTPNCPFRRFTKFAAFVIQIPNLSEICLYLPSFGDIEAVANHLTNINIHKNQLVA